MKTPKTLEKEKDSIKKKIEKNELNTQHIKYDNFIFLNIKRGIKKKVYLSDIICCKADNTYTIFCLTNKNEYIVSYSIGEIEDFLTDFGFIRINRSYIVNPLHIDMIKCLKKPSLELINKIKLDVSKSKIKEIEQFLGEKYKCFTSL